jgi:hypothetical protein
MMCPVSRGQLHVELLFRNEQTKKERSFVFPLNIYSDIPEGYLMLGFHFDMQKRHGSFTKATCIFVTNRVLVKNTLINLYRFTNPNSQVKIRSFWWSVTR